MIDKLNKKCYFNIMKTTKLYELINIYSYQVSDFVTVMLLTISQYL